jgi:hypothetical protein
MKLRAALAALLIAATAQAATYDAMVVVPTPSNATTTNQQSAREVMYRMSVLAKVLRLAGTNYGTIRASDAKTEYCRTGVFVRSNGLVDSARCVIFPSYLGRFHGAVYGAACRPDSVMRISYGTANDHGAKVPWLFLMDSNTELDANVLGVSIFDDAATLPDTAGVSGSKDISDTTFPWTKADPTLRWRFCSFQAGYIKNVAAEPVGGMRIVLEGSIPAFKTEAVALLNSQFPCSMPSIDRAGVSLGADTVYVWDRLWANLASAPNAKTMTFVSWGGAGGNSGDSLYSGHGGIYLPPSEVGLDILVFGLAHFDSLTLSQTGRRLIFGNMKAPRKVGLTVDGGLSRQLRYYQQEHGIDPGDTTSFYSTLDSLRLANIPVTFGVNVDSAAAYARDIIKFKTLPRARFTPQVWTGLRDTLTLNTAARFTDLLGRWRKRTFIGDGSGAALDTSYASKLKQAHSVCDSIFGRHSATLLAPDDDYSPFQMRTGKGASFAASGTPSFADSALYAIGQAGFTTLRTDGKYSDADATQRGASGNPRGWWKDSGFFRNAIDNTNLKLLQHGGFELCGGLSWANAFQDSAAPWDSAAAGRFCEDRAVFGMWDMDGTRDSDSWYNRGDNIGTAVFYAFMGVKYNLEDYADPRYGTLSAEGTNCKQRLIRMGCHDLSGVNPNPARTGWLLIRWLDSWMKACNRADNLNLMQWAYPEDIDP